MSILFFQRSTDIKVMHGNRGSGPHHFVHQASVLRIVGIVPQRSFRCLLIHHYSSTRLFLRLCDQLLLVLRVRLLLLLQEGRVVLELATLASSLSLNIIMRCILPPPVKYNEFLLMPAGDALRDELLRLRKMLLLRMSMTYL